MGEVQDKQKIAEICGAIMGDGWIQSNGQSFFIAGNPIEDKDYYDSYLKELVNKILNVNVVPRNFSYWGVYGISVHKKEKIKKLLSFGLIKGRKVKSARVPEWIYLSKSKKIISAFLRGLFDTDGGISFQKDYTQYSTDFNSHYHTKPRVRIGCISERLIKESLELCNRLGLKAILRYRKGGVHNNRNCNDVYILEINRLDSINFWFKELLPSNQKHKTKYLIWKKFGFCPPNTTLSQRKDILKNSLNPYNLYEGVAKRSNARDSKSRGSVPSGVRIFSPSSIAPVAQSG